MAVPVIETVRPGVQFTPEAARSFRRLEAAKGGPVDVNSTYRDWGKQLSMFNAWNAYVNGTGPYPGHSRAIHPNLSMHCKGLALDSDDWVSSSFVNLAAEHGWIRTAANDPTERHHFEYQSWNDKHINDPVGKDDDMIINIKGIRGKRRGGLYYVSNGQATFIGGRTWLKQGRYPMFTNEKEIAVLQSKIKGLL